MPNSTTKSTFNYGDRKNKSGLNLNPLIKKVINTKEIISDPINFLISSLLKSIISLFIPILGQNISDIILRYKGQLFITITAIILTTSAILTPSKQNIIIEAKAKAKSKTKANSYKGLPKILNDYIEDGFNDSNSPIHSPFGGKSTKYTTITSYYMDPYYYKLYHRWHHALDIIPNRDYYQTNKAYKIYGDVIMFATCSGRATGKIDRNGANYIETKCKDGIHTTLHFHNKLNFVPFKSTIDIKAGQPIAVMGETGLAYGTHIHYVIIKNSQHINPLPYMNK